MNAYYQRTGNSKRIEIREEKFEQKEVKKKAEEEKDDVEKLDTKAAEEPIEIARIKTKEEIAKEKAEREAWILRVAVLGAMELEKTRQAFNPVKPIYGLIHLQLGNSIVSPIEKAVIEWLETEKAAREEVIKEKAKHETRLILLGVVALAAMKIQKTEKVFNSVKKICGLEHELLEDSMVNAINYYIRINNITNENIYFIYQNNIYKNIKMIESLLTHDQVFNSVKKMCDLEYKLLESNMVNAINYYIQTRKITNENVHSLDKDNTSNDIKIIAAFFEQNPQATNDQIEQHLKTTKAEGNRVCIIS
jgi:hypothetical protein